MSRRRGAAAGSRSHEPLRRPSRPAKRARASHRQALHRARLPAPGRNCLEPVLVPTMQCRAHEQDWQFSPEWSGTV